MPQLDFDGANSKISADKIQGQSGTTVTIPAGHNLVGDGSGLTGVGLPDVGCWVYNSINQSIPANSWTKLEQDVISYDLGNNYDNTTNYRFVCPTAGKYLVVMYQCWWNQTTDGCDDRIGLYLNGTQRWARQTPGGAQHTPQYSHTIIVNASANDYIEMWVRHNMSSAHPSRGGTAATLGTSMQIQQLK